jgi:alpha-N-arabinofuranosidase
MSRAEVSIDTRRVIGRVSPLVYGHFIEHLGRCIYGGVYEEGSDLADQHGFRTDVLAATAELAPTIARYPGGNFASGYHWRDGVGPPGRRPRRWDRAWRTVETNQFGTDEFIRWCRQLRAEPYLCVNLGDGDATEAADWVEYCNATCDTSLTRLRQDNGSPGPHNVRYWGLGNELYGDWQIGAKEAGAYADAARDAARSMRRVDPDIKLVAVGCNEKPDWNLTVLRKLWDTVDYLALHLYVGCPDAQSHLAYGLVVDHHIRQMRSAIEMVAAEQLGTKRVEIAFDEWNVWYRHHRPPLEERYDLADAVVVAQFLNAFIRHCDIVTMANLAQLVNVLGAIMARPDGMFRQTIYWPLWMYRKAMLGCGLDVWCQSPTAEMEVHWAGSRPSRHDVPIVDVGATGDPAEGKVALAVVNRSLTRQVDLAIHGVRFDRDVEAQLLSGDDPHSVNDFSCPDRIGPESVAIGSLLRGQSLRIPPLSVSVLAGTAD